MESQDSSKEIESYDFKFTDENTKPISVSSDVICVSGYTETDAACKEKKKLFSNGDKSEKQKEYFLEEISDTEVSAEQEQIMTVEAKVSDDPNENKAITYSTTCEKKKKKVEHLGDKGKQLQLDQFADVENTETAVIGEIELSNVDQIVSVELANVDERNDYKEFEPTVTTTCEKKEKTSEPHGDGGTSEKTQVDSCADVGDANLTSTVAEVQMHCVEQLVVGETTVVDELIEIKDSTYTSPVFFEDKKKKLEPLGHGFIPKKLQQDLHDNIGDLGDKGKKLQLDQFADVENTETGVIGEIELSNVDQIVSVELANVDECNDYREFEPTVTTTCEKKEKTSEPHGDGGTSEKPQVDFCADVGDANLTSTVAEVQMHCVEQLVVGETTVVDELIEIKDSTYTSPVFFEEKKKKLEPLGHGFIPKKLQQDLHDNIGDAEKNVLPKMEKYQVDNIVTGETTIVGESYENMASNNTSIFDRKKKNLELLDDGFTSVNSQVDYFADVANAKMTEMEKQDLVTGKKTIAGKPSNIKESTITTATKQSSLESSFVSNGSLLLSGPDLNVFEYETLNMKRKRDEASDKEGDDNSIIEIGKKDDTIKITKVLKTENFCYRLLHENDSDTSALTPKNSFSNESVENHVRTGSQYGFQSKYISTSRTYSAVWQLVCLKCRGNTNTVRIAKIDLNELDPANVIDLTTEENRSKYLSSYRAISLARNFQEILIIGSIPKSAFEIIYSGSKNACPSTEIDLLLGNLKRRNRQLQKIENNNEQKSLKRNPTHKTSVMSKNTPCPYIRNVAEKSFGNVSHCWYILFLFVISIVLIYLFFM